MYFGIDPGTKGGIAILVDDDLVTLPFSKWTWHEITDELHNIDADDHDFAVVEKVSAMPKQGVAGVFTFGRATGIVTGLLIARAIPFEEITPQKWQAAFGMKKKKGETKTAWKKRLQARAHELFPSYIQDIPVEVADAVLIAEYCRRTRNDR